MCGGVRYHRDAWRAEVVQYDCVYSPEPRGDKCPTIQSGYVPYRQTYLNEENQFLFGIIDFREC
jgi:hypothetical protein